MESMQIIEICIEIVFILRIIHGTFLPYCDTDPFVST